MTFSTEQSFRTLEGVDVPSHVEWHHHLNGSISWVTLQDEFRLNRQSGIMS